MRGHEVDWIFVAIAYLLGCIPFGLVVARFKGVDLRSAGSGNIGATNALRAMGKGAGALTLVGDMLKGVAAVLLATRFAGAEAGLLAALAAVVGHDFPVFLGFKGGKGVATSFGVMLALDPMLGLLGLATWLIAFIIWRYSSLAALVSFALTPLGAWALNRGQGGLALLCSSLTALIIVKHRGNISRLLKGEEPRVGNRGETVNG